MRPRGRAALAPAALLAALVLAAAPGAAQLLPPGDGPAAAPPAAAVAAPEVREIAVAGARMVAEATIRARIASREGAPYDPEQVSKDVRAVYELGSFEDVTVDAEAFEGGLRLTFRVSERPLLRDVSFEGNREGKADELREKAAFVLNAPYNPLTVEAALARVRAFYREKGFYQALLRTDTEPAGEGQVRLKVVVEEGRQYKLVSIALRGVKALPEGEVRDQLRSKVWGFWSWAGGSGRLQPELLQEDRQRIAAYYQDHGYLEARVGEPELSVDDTERVIRVVLPVAEGRQYRLGATALEGDDLVPLEEIRGLIGVREGEVFRRSTFAQGMNAVFQRYASRGYAFVNVDHVLRPDAATGTVDVTFHVARGPLARFGRVTIGGNVTTRDRVIRRALTFAEGDVYNALALERSRQRVFNLALFESVDLVPRPRGEDVVDVDIQVKERLTGQIQFGAGYSTDDKLTGQLRLAESNLFGRGQTLALTVEYSTVRRNYSVSFSEPSLFDGPWSFGFSVYDMLREFDEYDRKSIGGRVTVGRAVGEYSRVSLSPKHETVTVSNVDEAASSYIQEQEGKATTNSLRLQLTRDSRNNWLNPTRGSRSSLGLEYAGGLFGGDNYFTRLEAEHSVYVPIAWKIVGVLHGEYGRIQGFDGRTPPIYEKFFPGGITTLRGFNYREVGPKDENGDPVGGTQQLIFNAEALLPIVPEQGFNLVVFFDTGNAWGEGEAVALDDLRESAGAGIRWMSPIGPFRLEWGYVLDRQEGEPASRFDFTIGNFF